jgi:hypothetical protein
MAKPNSSVIFSIRGFAKLILNAPDLFAISSAGGFPFPASPYRIPCRIAEDRGFPKTSVLGKIPWIYSLAQNRALLAHSQLVLGQARYKGLSVSADNTTLFFSCISYRKILYE